MRVAIGLSEAARLKIYAPMVVVDRQGEQYIKGILNVSTSFKASKSSIVILSATLLARHGPFRL